MRNRVVRFAIGGLGRARRTAEAECFEMLRIADRPAAHAGPQLHKFDGNQHRRRIIPRFPIVYPVRCGAIAWETFSKIIVFRHLKSIESFYDYLTTIAIFSGLDTGGTN